MQRIFDGALGSVTGYFAIHEFNADFWQAVLVGIGTAIVREIFNRLSVWYQKRKKNR